MINEIIFSKLFFPHLSVRNSAAIGTCGSKHSFELRPLGLVEAGLQIEMHKCMCLIRKTKLFQLRHPLQSAGCLNFRRPLLRCRTADREWR